jgi:hypothetical protein
VTQDRPAAPSAPSLRGTGAKWTEPDRLLALAVATVAFAAATRGGSLLLAPLAWGLGARYERRCREQRTYPSGRGQWALAIGRTVTCYLPSPLAFYAVVRTQGSPMLAIFAALLSGALPLWLLARLRRRRESAVRPVRDARRAGRVA